jgi:hypothetical protein
MDEKATPHYPVPADHTLQVYAAIIGQAPAVVPEEDPLQRRINSATGFRRIALVAWAEACRQWKTAYTSPQARSRLGPFLDPLLKRWREARTRLAARQISKPKVAKPAPLPTNGPRQAPLPTVKANGKAFIARSEITPTSYPTTGAPADRPLGRIVPDAPLESQTPWSFNDRA